MKTVESATMYRDALKTLHAGHPATALMLARDLIELDPSESRHWFLYGTCLSGLVRYDEAEEALLRCMQLLEIESPEFAYYPLVEMARIFDKRGQLAQAEVYYRRAREAGPQAAQPNICLGGFLARQGRLHEAEYVHRHGTGCSRGPVDEAWLNLGLVLRAQERFDEALACFEKALQLDPDYADAAIAAGDMKRVLRLISKRKMP